MAHVEEFPDDWETTDTVIRETGRKVPRYFLWAEKGSRRDLVLE